MKKELTKKRNEIRMTDMEEKLFQSIKKSAAVNKRSMGKEAEFILSTKTKTK